jgi:predicted component of type VI protein secretion system
VATFMSFFLRGNRDTQVRSQAGSIQQELALMNDNFVNSRTKAAASPVIANIAKLKDNESILTEIFLTFLSRHPSDREHTVGINFLNQQASVTGPTTAVEDLVWAAINKVDFIFSY